MTKLVRFKIMRLIKIADVMLITGLARPTIYKFIKTKGFPKQVNLGRAARWDEDEVGSWISNQIAARK